MRLAAFFSVLVVLAGVALASSQAAAAAEPFDHAKFTEVLQFFGLDFPCYMCEQIASLTNEGLCLHLREAGLEGHCEQIAREYATLKDTQSPKEYCTKLQVCK